MMKLSDYVIRFLEQKGITALFLVSGGGIMHLLDSVGRSRALKYFCNYHEQASAISAEGYARVKNTVGACLVTTGPGSTNALSGIAGAWVDSIPVVVISGQVRRELIADYSRHRQIGPQEINIIEMARPVTKYAVTVMDPHMIRYELEAAFFHATDGRPGPVWINIPLDIQGTLIDEERLVRYPDKGRPLPDEEALGDQIASAIAMIQKAERPILICGNGIRLAHAEGLLPRFVEATGIPVILTIGGMDLVGETDEHFIGRFGPIGQRRANFALQNSDLVLSIGASMSVSSIGFNTSGFAPRAKKIMVNIDASELDKPNYQPDLAVCADAGVFMREFLEQMKGKRFAVSPRWIEACEHWKRRYPIITPDYSDDSEHVNSYIFADRLSDMLTSEDIVVTGNALDAWSVYQAFRVTGGQRVFTNVCYGAMGWDLPAAIGACIANDNKRTVLVAGDGTIQFNIQELKTIGFYRLNIKIFVLNNRGYESIRSTQKNFFDGHFVGADEGSGVANPDFAKLAAAYGLSYGYIRNNDEIGETVKRLLSGDGPVLCEVNLSYFQGRTPRVSSFRNENGNMESRPLEDMSPLLDRKELWENMHRFDTGEGDDRPDRQEIA